MPKGWYWDVGGEWAWKRRTHAARQRKWRKELGKDYPTMTASDYGIPHCHIYAPGYEKAPIGTEQYRAMWASAAAQHPALAIAAACLKAK